jgi:hypothetical protein
MIPKKIHYCWLSKENIPLNLKMCINSWNEIMPDYEIILWDKSRFDINSVFFVKEACKVKKWAFAADYIRLYALYSEGGIYLDSDVIVKKNFDPYLEYDFFTSLEYHPLDVEKENTLDLLNDDGTSKIPFTHKPGIGIQAAVLGSIKGHAYLRDCLEYYRDKHFILQDGSYYNKFIAPSIYASIAERYGFRYKNELQNLNSNMLILPSEIFAGGLDQATDKSYAIHCCAGSWKPRNEKSCFDRVLDKIKKNTVIRKLFRRPPVDRKIYNF